MSPTPKVSLVGVGKMGEFHLKKLLGVSGSDLIGFFDEDKFRSEQIATQYSVKRFSNLTSMLEQSDAVVVASPTATHTAVCRQALQNGCHVFVEKPLALDIDEAREVVRLASEKKCILQVGFLERFRFRALSQGLVVHNFREIETQRLSLKPGREMGIDVVFDLMIHDLDLVASLVKQMPLKVSASGWSEQGSYLDEVVTTLEFPSGKQAKLTASRVAENIVRKLSLINESAVTEFDFTQNYVNGTLAQVPKTFDALSVQAHEFVRSVKESRQPLVTGADGLNALILAKQVHDAAWENPTSLREIRESFMEQTTSQ